MKRFLKRNWDAILIVSLYLFFMINGEFYIALGIAIGFCAGTFWDIYKTHRIKKGG